MAVALGCPEPEPTSERVVPPEEAVGAGTEPVGEERVAAGVWPTEVESLQESVDAFVSVDDCVAALRARTPTAVSEGIADLAYDGFFDHVCRSMAAVKAGSLQGCDALPISAARAGCRRRLAIVHNRPAACPEDRVTPGREPLCVAWAARDRGLCRASDEARECRAVLDGDAEACGRGRGAERCRAWLRRYGGAIGDAVSESGVTAPAFTLELRALAQDPETLQRDVLDHGVRLVPDGCRWDVALAHPRGEPSLTLGFRDEPPRFHLELTVPPRAAAPASLPLGADAAVLSAVTPSLGPMTSIVGAEGEVRLERFEPRLGGAISGRLRGSLRRGDERVAVTGRFVTFVRDLEPLPEHCAGR
jgi:hypothetical protein